MKAAAFSYARAATVSQVFDFIDQHDGEAKLIAGGQSLVPALNMRLANPSLLIDINGIDALKGIRIEGDSVIVGALTRHCELEQSAVIAEHVPLLKLAVRHVAHAAIRSRGTLGGSIANADPAAELPACAVALDAVFRIASKAGERRVAARDFFKGFFETDLAAGEVLLAAEFPRRQSDCWSGFQEIARRQGDYATVGLAAQARIGQGAIRDARLAFFGTGPAPVLANGAARALEGRKWDPGTIATARQALADELDPLPDLHHSAATKRHLAGVLLQRVLADLSGQCA